MTAVVAAKQCQILGSSKSFVQFLEIDVVGYFAHPRDSRMPIASGGRISWELKPYIVMCVTWDDFYYPAHRCPWTKKIARILRGVCGIVNFRPLCNLLVYLSVRFIELSERQCIIVSNSVQYRPSAPYRSSSRLLGLPLVPPIGPPMGLSLGPRPLGPSDPRMKITFFGIQYLTS